MGLLGGLNAQNGFNMPYSQFGIGLTDLPYNMPLANRTGGVVYTQSGDNFINPFNPASYASIGMESFIFDMGANIQLTRLKNNEKGVSDADGNISHLAFGMPITNWWKIAGGLIAYTSVDYASVSQGIYLDSSIVKTVYDGTGGVNMAFLGSAFNILGNGKEGRRLQAGFNINYLTGRVQHAITYSFMGIDSTHYKPSRRYRETKVGNVTFDLGLQYWEPLGEKYTLGLGLVYKPYRKMNVTDMALIYTFNTSDQSLSDTIFPAPGESAEFASILEQDHTFGVGLTLERNNSWRVSADATFAGWSGMKYTEGVNPPIMGQSALTTGPYSRYALGFEKVGVMDKANCINYAVTGPAGRAAGWANDVRKNHPYDVYDKVEWKQITLTGCDSMDRYLVHIQEMYQSLDIIEQLIDNIPEGDFYVKQKAIIKVPEGQWYFSVEGASGEFGVYLDSRGDKSPYRLKMRPMGLTLVGALDPMLRGQKIADLVSTGAAIDFVIPDIDR